MEQKHAGSRAAGILFSRVAQALGTCGLLAVLHGCAGLPVTDTPPTWAPQSSGVAVSLRGLCAVSAEVAWASGAGGTVLRTEDGGRSWRQIHVDGAEELDFRDVHATGSRRAWLMTAGQPARIYETRDGGDSWTVRHEDPRAPAFFDSIAFWPDGSGLLFGDPVDGVFCVHQCDPGGPWRAVPAASLPAPADGEAGFAASGTCIATHGHARAWIATGGKQARVLHTVDRGQTWDAQATPMRHGMPSTGTFSVAFASASDGVLVGGNYLAPDETEGNAAWTADGGARWQLAQSPPAGYRSGVAHCGGRGGPSLLCVGPSGADYSIDGGRTWTSCDTEGYHAIAFAPGRRTGWAVGGDGRIARVTW